MVPPRKDKPMAEASVDSRGEPSSSVADGGEQLPSPRSLVLPRALRKGDTVGIVAPSSPPFEEGDIEFTYKWLSKLGLKWKLGKHVFDRWGDLAGADEARLEDLHAMYADREVSAILPVRGGNGSVRLLPSLDFDLISANPKILVGYSDITGLIIPIHQRTGQVTFHGPTAGSFFESPYTYNHFIKLLMTPKAAGLIADPVARDVWNPEYPPARLAVAEGEGRGPLVGGCLTLIRQMMGTPFEIDTKDKILFVEDVEEEPHSIDRMLTQLELAGKLDGVRGIVVGECVGCKPGGSKRNSLPLNFSVERMLRERLGDLGIPVVYGIRLGHSREKCTLPIGVTATLKVTAKGARLKLEEPATRA